MNRMYVLNKTGCDRNIYCEHLPQTQTNIDIFNVYMYVYTVMSFRCFYIIATDYLDIKT